MHPFHRSGWPTLVLPGAALLLAWSMWFYVNQVLIAHQRAEAAQKGTPRGNLSDLYPRWLGSRELLLHGRNPYSHEITGEIQEGYWGRRLDPQNPSDPKDEQAFAYPAYVTILLAPTVKLPFPAVQRGAVWVLTALTVVSVFWWMRALRWRPDSSVTLAVLLLTVGSFQYIQGIKLQQLTLLVAAILAASTLLMVRGWLFAAGILLAVATIKPQLIAPLGLFLCFWTSAQWRQRQRLFWGFALTLAALVACAQLLLPTWIPDFWQAMAAYRQYTGGKSMLDVFAGPIAGKVLTLLALAVIAFLSWKFRNKPSDSPEFSLMLAFVLAATLAVIPMFAPYNQILLLPAIFVVLRDWPLAGERQGLVRLGGIAAALFIGWPWITSLGLLIASCLVPAQMLQRGWMIPLWTTFAIPGICVALLGLWILDAYARLAGSSRQTPAALALNEHTR